MNQHEKNILFKDDCLLTLIHILRHILKEWSDDILNLLFVWFEWFVVKNIRI